MLDKRSFLVDNLHVCKGSILDYDILSKYHYQPPMNPPFSSIFKLSPVESHTGIFPDPVSVIVYKPPLKSLRARRHVTRDFFNRFDTQEANLRLLSDYVTYLTRLITDPRFLRQGCATKLVTESLRLCGYPIVEVLIQIDFTNSMYRKAGFELYFMPYPPSYLRLCSVFSDYGMTLVETLSPIALRDFIDSQKGSIKSMFIDEITKFLCYFRRVKPFDSTLDLAKYLLSKVPPARVYGIWFDRKSDYAQRVLDYRQNLGFSYDDSDGLHRVSGNALVSGRAFAGGRVP